MTRKMCSQKVSSPLTVYNSRKGHNFQRQSGVKLFSFFFSLDLLLEDEISASLRDLRRFLMRIPFILSLDFFSFRSGFCCTKSSFRISIE